MGLLSEVLISQTVVSLRFSSLIIIIIDVNNIGYQVKLDALASVKLITNLYEFSSSNGCTHVFIVAHLEIVPINFVSILPYVSI